MTGDAVAGSARRKPGGSVAQIRRRPDHPGLAARSPPGDDGSTSLTPRSELREELLLLKLVRKLIGWVPLGVEFTPPRGSAAEDSVGAMVKIGATVKIKPSAVISC